MEHRFPDNPFRIWLSFGVRHVFGSKGSDEQFATVLDIGDERATPSIDDHLPIIASDEVAFAGMLKERGVCFFACTLQDRRGVALD